MTTITYRPTQSDLIHAARAWEGQHWKVVRYLVSAVLIICGMFIVISSGPWWGTIFVFVGILEAFNLLPGAVLRAIIEFRMNPKFREEFQVTLTPECLHFRTATIDSKLKWSMYSNCIETDRAFILVYGKHMYSVIPKRALDSDSKVIEIRELLSSVIGTRKNNA